MPFISNNPVVVPAQSAQTFNTVWFNMINITANDLSASGKVRAACQVSLVAQNTDGSYTAAPKGTPGTGGMFMIPDIYALIPQYTSLPVTMTVNGATVTGLEAVIMGLLTVIQAQAVAANVIA